jgi:hypothetical protein
MVGFADSKTNCVAKFAVVVQSRIVKYLMHLQEDYWTLSALFFDCKQQRLMYILQNQNDCPRLDHLQLNVIFITRIKKHNTPLLEFS